MVQRNAVVREPIRGVPHRPLAEHDAAERCFAEYDATEHCPPRLSFVISTKPAAAKSRRARGEISERQRRAKGSTEPNSQISLLTLEMTQLYLSTALLNKRCPQGVNGNEPPPVRGVWYSGTLSSANR